jgi:hypothetical protein
MPLETNSLRRGIAYASVVVLLVAGSMTGAVLFFQATEHATHVHAALTGWQASLPVFVDWAGFIAIIVLAVQVMFGYRLFGVGRSARARHVLLAWSVVVLLGLHGVSGVIHSLQGNVETIPLYLDVIGLGVAALLVVQLATGYGRAKGLPGRAVTHSWIGIAVAVIIAAHGLIGVWHTLTG